MAKFENLTILKRFLFDIRRNTAKVLSARLPKMLYFAEYDKLPGKISLDELIRNKNRGTLTKADRIFIALLDLANSSINKIQGITRLNQLIIELNIISQTLTDKIFKYWSQNKDLEVEISAEPGLPNDPPPLNEGIVFSTGINNKRDSATINFDEKSSGFIWFFSFLVWLSQVRETYGDNIIVLFDEPGLTLHGTAQKDLLRYINEELAVQGQVMYTTHSPFMLNVKEINSIRIVEDIGNKDQREHESGFGTKVGMETLSRDMDTLLPLQGSVGFDVAQAMFVGPYILFVEGVSDAGYINWFSRVLMAKGCTSLDLSWIICPTTGINNFGSFIRLFKGRVLKIVALVDFHKDQADKVRKLAENELDKGCLLKTTDFINQEEAEIEDLVGWGMMRYLVHKRKKLPIENQLPENKPESEDKEIRIVKIIDEHMKKLPAHFPNYNHNTIVKSLQKVNINDLDSINIKGFDEALKRFEKLFSTLNELINEEEE